MAKMPLLCAEKTLSTKLRKWETIKAGSKGAVQGAKPTKEFKSKYTFDIVCLGLFHCHITILLCFIFTIILVVSYMCSQIYLCFKEKTFIWLIFGVNVADIFK